MTGLELQISGVRKHGAIATAQAKTLTCVDMCQILFQLHFLHLESNNPQKI